MKKHLLSAISVLTLTCAATFSTQAETYPDKAINWVVPLAPGGPADTLTRNIANRLSQKLGASIVIENVTGAGGTIGATKAAGEPHDGYHFLMGHMGFMAAAPSLYKNLNYDPVQDFQAVFRFPDTPAVLLVPADSPFNSVDDLIKHAKANPGSVNFGTAGVGSVSHLVAELFASEVGIQIQTVPYRGNAPAVADLMADRLDGVFDMSNTALAHVRGGKIKALGVGSAEPMEQFKGVPTIASSVPGFEAAAWYGIYAPAGTPQSYLDTLEQAYLSIMDDDKLTAQFIEQGLQPLDSAAYRGDNMQQLTARDKERWATVIANAKIQPQ